MQCPVCQVDLVVTDRQGVEIDYCPKCRGVWLDRGELDKIVERSAVGIAPQAGGERHAHEDRVRYHDDDDDHHGERYPGGRRKRRGFLGELFDFD